MHSFLQIFWDPNPLLLDFGFLKVAWYGAMWAISFLMSYYLMASFFKLEKQPEKWLDSLLISMVLASMLGARLGHCLFYEPEYYLSNPLQILMIHKGGMASHGGAIGIILTVFFWSRKVSKKHMVWILDRIVIGVAIAGTLIRVGNLINQEIVGAPTNAAHGFIFPSHDQSDDFRAEPSDEGILVSFRQGMQKAGQYDLLRSYNEKDFSSVSGTWKGNRKGSEPWIQMNDLQVKDTCCVTYTLMYNQVMSRDTVPGADSNDTRLVVLEQNVASSAVELKGHWDGDSVRLNFVWGDPSMEGNFTVMLMESYEPGKWKKLKSMDLAKGAGSAKIKGAFRPDSNRPVTYKIALKEAADLHYIVRHPAQIYEAACYLITFIFLYFLYRKQKGKIPRGQLFGLFLIMVFSARFIIEFVKANQEAFEEGLPLNMGQLLSIPFILAGLFFLISSLKKKKFD